MGGPGVPGVFTEPLSGLLQWLLPFRRIISILAGGFTGSQRGNVTCPKLGGGELGCQSFCQSSRPPEGEQIDVMQS